MQIKLTSFWNELYSNYFTLFQNVTYKNCIKRKECSFPYGFLQTYILDKQIVSKSLFSFSFLYVLQYNITRDLTELITYEAINIKYSECVSVALVTHHAKHIHRILLSSVAPLDVPYFSTLSPKELDFRKNVAEHKIFVLIFCTTFVWNISSSKKMWARYYQKCT